MKKKSSAQITQEWLLYRIDDNGNRFEMQRFSSREEAMKRANYFEHKKHKQSYFVSKI